MQEKKQKGRVILANDLAGLGKVALANSIPIMACAGIETAILPTVLLSSHTGGFKNVHIDDCTQEMRKFLKQWQDLDIEWEAIVTGYLKSEEQILLLKEILQQGRLGCPLLIVDPVMADHGNFYSGFDAAYAEKMRSLCALADYILPNLTEACLLSGSPMLHEGEYTETELELLAERLLELGAKNLIITGISFEEKSLATAFYEETTGRLDYVFTEKLPRHFFGTGDLFTAILSCCIVRRISLKDAVDFAMRWMHACLKHTISLERDLRYGVSYEPFLKAFIEGIEDLMERNR